MAKRYTATAQLRCGKQHTCASCGCVFSYIMQRTVVGSGASPERANANLQSKYVKAQRDENDMHPCPNCGQYQQDMIGSRLAKKRKMIALAAFIMPVLIPVLRGTYAVQANTLTWIALLYCAAILVVQFLLGLHNPNRDREANRGVAADSIVRGTMRAQPMTTAPELLNPNTTELPSATQSIGHKVVMLLFLIAVLLAVSPEAIRTANKWPLNAECYPPVVGPADTARVYMKDSIQSVKGYWRGTPKAACQNPGQGGGLVTIAARTNQNDWGDTIEAKSDEESSTSHPWVELTFPDTAELAGKTINCSINLMVEFPQLAGASQFRQIRQQMGRDVTIQFASAYAGSRYDSAWWSCTALALMTVLVGSIALVYVARAYQRKSKPAQVFQVPKD